MKIARKQKKFLKHNSICQNYEKQIKKQSLGVTVLIVLV